MVSNTTSITGLSFLSLQTIYSYIEYFRIKNHLRLVEQFLRGGDVSHLSTDLKKKRVLHLDRLHDYWKAGIFPTNTLFPDKRMPFFIDDFGVRCAMAYIIEQSGEKKLVQDVKRVDNLVFINDIKSGPVLEWIKQSGLTQQEAALIQPSYGPCGYGGCEIMVRNVILFWIVSGIGFIISEYIQFTLIRWFTGLHSLKRLISVILFTLNGLFLSMLIGIYSINIRILDFLTAGILFTISLIALIGGQFFFSHWIQNGTKVNKIVGITFFTSVSLLNSWFFIYNLFAVIGININHSVFIK